MEGIDADVIGQGLGLNDQGVDNQTLIQVNEEIRNHPVEDIGRVLRGYTTARSITDQPMISHEAVCLSEAIIRLSYSSLGPTLVYRTRYRWLVLGENGAGKSAASALSGMGICFW